MPKLLKGNDGYNFKKSNTKINIMIIIRPIFNFFKFLKLFTTWIGVTVVFSFFNLFHFIYQYILPCTNRNSKRKKEIQKAFFLFTLTFQFVVIIPYFILEYFLQKLSNVCLLLCSWLLGFTFSPLLGGDLFVLLSPLLR